MCLRVNSTGLGSSIPWTIEKLEHRGVRCPERAAPIDDRHKLFPEFRQVALASIRAVEDGARMALDIHDQVCNL